MGWEWKDDDNDDVSSKHGGDVDVFDEDSNPRRISGDGDRCSTRKVVKSQCRTEEVEPGKFIRKCEKSESIFKDCLGRPSEVVQSNKEYTEEDVTEEVVKFSENGPFDFPGLRSDMEAIERSFLGGIGRFFEAAEEMKKGLFNVFGDPHFYDGDSSSSSSSTRQGIPIEAHPPSREASPKSESRVDLSGLAKDV